MHHTNFAWLLVIIKSSWPPKYPNVPSNTRNDVLQLEEHEANIEDQVNDPMKKDNNNNIVQDDGTNELIQDLFAWPDEDDDIDDIDLDVPLLDKENTLLYEGSRENLLSATLLLVNFKVLNGLLNTCMS